MAAHEPAKIKMAELMMIGVNWQEAAKQAGVVTNYSSAYRFSRAYSVDGERVLEERRRGHAHKVIADVLAGLLEECRQRPETTAIELQAALQERFHVRVSKSHINRVRAAYGVSRPKKKRV